MKLFSLRPAFLAAFLLLFLNPVLHAQQRGTITGTVLDASNGSPLTRATVKIIEGGKGGCYSNTSGGYRLEGLAPGSYTIKVVYAGYDEKTVAGIVVGQGTTARQDVSLGMAKGTVITVTAQANQQSESAVLLERRKSNTVDDAISAQEIARAPASDAGDAMRRVTGVSVVGNKYVVVRGLSERYSATELNGVNLPSPEPEKKVVPFDLFPSSMISRLTTVKTFTPDNPGDFAGGLVKITTKDYPESFLFGLSVGASANSQSTGSGAIGYKGGATDYLGVDDGTRALPANLETGRRPTVSEQADLLRRFSNNVWTPQPASVPLGGSWNFTLGDRYDVGIPVGFLLSGSYAKGTDFRVENQAYPLLSSTAGKHDLRYDYTAERAETSILWGGLVNLSAELAPEHKISLKTIYNHTSDDESRRVTGLYNQSTTGDILYTRLRFLERSLFSTNLSGVDQFEDLANLRLEWRGSYSQAERHEPDNRSATYLKGHDETIYRFVNNFGGNNGRFFSDLSDRESSIGADATLPIHLGEAGPLRLKVGGLGRFRSRDFSARRFAFTTTTNDPALTELSPEMLFTPEHVERGEIVFNDETLSTDRYDASETISAGYGMIDVPLGAGLRLVAGGRFENWSIQLGSINPLNDVRDTAQRVDRSKSDLLPSLNIIYALSQEMNLRGSFTRTLARPEFRELAPFRFDDYRQSTYGNPALQPTKITNYDLRWEWFPGSGEVIAVSGFLKEFIDPIEQMYLIGGSGIAVEPANANRAESMGAEFEFRKGLGFIAPTFENFGLGLNLTLVSSDVSFNPGEFVQVFDGVAIIPYSASVLTNASRPLQGQSPFVVNFSLGYDNSDIGTSITLLVNSFGRRLAYVGTEGIPDTYEQSRSTFDISAAQKLPLGLQLRLSAKNLLDDEVLLSQEFSSGEIIRTESYHTGRSISLGLSFSFDQYQLNQP